MMQEGMELPMGEDRVAPLITKVLLLISLSLISQHSTTNPPIYDDLVFYHFFALFLFRLYRKFIWQVIYEV